MGTIVSRAEMGDTVQDTVTGMKGVVTAVSLYLNGCRRCLVEGTFEGNKPLECWFDDTRLLILKVGTCAQWEASRTAPADAPPGGPGSVPTRNDPSR